MRLQKLLTIILLKIIFLTLFKTITSQTDEPQLDFLGGNCLKSDNITINGTYHNNIHTLLENLYSLSSINQFIIDSSGTGPNRVNGFFLCRPDIDLATCKRCFIDAADSLLQFCFDKKEAVVWYEECMIRYTNNSISPSNNDPEPSYFNHGTFNVSEPQIFPKLVNTTIKALISKAVSPDNEPYKFYAVHGQSNYTFFEGFYGMVLCRPDISPEDCESCLTTALERIPVCCADSLAEWTSVFLANCQLRYDTAPFIFPSHREALSLPPSSSPSLLPSPTAVPSP
ncbi:Cysteine-rich receptor-like protein kinase 25 [Bienertia sinuspersici]